MAQRVVEYTQSCIYEYLEEVLTYYKTEEHASFGEWPDVEIGWMPFSKSMKFYAIVSHWFAESDIHIIRWHDTNRYLSTFIVAAEFPPSLGYKKLITELVARSGWLSLYRSPQDFIDTYIDSAILANYTVAERQSLSKDSEGYFAFIELVTILASIRYLLGTTESLEEICVKVATEYERDIELVQRIAHAYRDTLTPPVNDARTVACPQFSFQLRREDTIWKFVIKHNLNKKTRIQIPSSVQLGQFSIGTLSCIAGQEMVHLATSSDSVQLEATGGHADLDCRMLGEHFPISKRDEDLKNIQFLLTVTDRKSNLHSLNIGGIHRQDNFLVFDMQGNEIITKSRLFSRGQSLLVVPLNLQVGQALAQSPVFERLKYPETIPIFVLQGNPEEVNIDGTMLHFCEVPFSIDLRTQTAWEQTFSTQSTYPNYFFSPLMQISLDGDFAGSADPHILLSKMVTRGGVREYDTIKTKYEHTCIKPIPKLPSPGTYKLIVKFGNDFQRVQYFRLLPIRSVRLVSEKHIQIKLYAQVESFQLLGNLQCVVSYDEDLVDLRFAQYGNHQIDANYRYKMNNRPVTTLLKFFFQAQQEVVGHFSRELSGVENDELSIQKDLIPSSCFEFRRNNLRDPSQRYSISFYMEGEPQQGLFPKYERHNVDGNERVPLIHLVTSIKRNGYSRLLLLVHCGDKELFRATFTDRLSNIINLEDEWKKGYYHELLILPVYSLDKYSVTDLSAVPDNCVVYGMIHDENGEPQYATHGLYIPPMRDGIDAFQKLIYAFSSNASKDEVWILLRAVLTSPELACTCIAWFTKASRWDYPYDIFPYTYLLDSYPIIVAWADLARDPENRNNEFVLISQEAQFLHKIGAYLIPNGVNLASHPRYCPELITLNDIRTLEDLDLLPSNDKSAPALFALGIFCAMPFVSGSKPVLSWLTLFWFRSYCERNSLQEAYNQFPMIFLDNPQAVTELSQDLTRSMPMYANNRAGEQNIRSMFDAEQLHYIRPFHGLFPFFTTLESHSFTSGLVSIIHTQPLMYAEPLLEGFIRSTKWKFIVFFSLTVVCTQLDKQEILQKLHDLWVFTPLQYIYLLQWINQTKSITWIYNAYYEYWMKLFWEEYLV